MDKISFELSLLLGCSVKTNLQTYGMELKTVLPVNLK